MIFGSKAKKRDYYWDRAMQGTPREPLSNAGSRYRDLSKAKNYAEKISKKTKSEEDKIIFNKITADLLIEETRIERGYYDADAGVYVPNPMKPVVNSIIGLGLTVASLLGYIIYTGVNTWRKNYINESAAIEILPKLNRVISEKDYSESKKLYDLLVKHRNKLSEEDYQNIWQDTEGLGLQIRKLEESMEIFVDASDKFADYEKNISENKISAALKNLEEADAKLKVIDVNELPKVQTDAYNLLVQQVKNANEKYSHIKSSSKLFTPIKESIVPNLQTQFKSLEELLSKEELFEKEKAVSLLDQIRNYDFLLNNSGIIDPDSIGKEDFEKVKSTLISLREAISNKRGLLTRYAELQKKHVETSFKEFEKLNIELTNSFYLDDNISEKLDKLSTIYTRVNTIIADIDARRIDTFLLSIEGRKYQETLKTVQEKTKETIDLKKNSESADIENKISASLELFKRHFERDHVKEDWTGALKYLERIPDSRIEPIKLFRDIIQLDREIDAGNHSILVTETGLTSSDVMDYKNNISKTEDKIFLVDELLKEADLAEGKKAKLVLEELNKLQTELTEVESQLITSPPNIQELNEKGSALTRNIEELKPKVEEALDSFGNAAEKFLNEKGTKIPSLEKLQELSGLYKKADKFLKSVEIAEQIIKLRTKYKQ